MPPERISITFQSIPSPHRPNPIGLSVVKLERVYVENHKRYIEISSIENSFLFYSLDMDLVDGTPVLDIKPYLPSYDYIKDAVVPKYSLCFQIMI